MAPGPGADARYTDSHDPGFIVNNGVDHWTQIANEHWLKTSRSKKVKPDVIKRDIWDVLEKGGFESKSLLALENLQLLEYYLWPVYNEDSSNHHVILVAIMVYVKHWENLPIWEIFADRPSDFSSLFRRILSMTLDISLHIPIRTYLLSFIISAFQSLDSGMVRKECAPLVSIAIWHNLASDAAREHKLERHGQLKRAWRASAKRYDAADEPTKAKLRFERSWLYSLVLDFFAMLYDSTEQVADNLMYCERFIEFLTDLDSQLPTRRYVNTLLLDLNLLPIIRLSPVFNDGDNGQLRDLYNLLLHFVYFSIDDHTGAQYSREESYQAHCTNLARLQKTALSHFKAKLTILALSNYAAIDKRTELEGHLAALTDLELAELCAHLELRTNYPKSKSVVIDRKFLIEVLLCTYERRSTFQEVVGEMNILPTENALFEPTLLRNETYNGTRPLAIPKLNLQYLSVGDFLWRSFILHRCESFFEIRKDIEDALKRLQPRTSQSAGSTRFDGFSKMALPISKPVILEAAPPKVGEDIPAFVRAEILLDVSRLNEGVRRDWDSLRREDVVFLMAVSTSDESLTMMHGHGIQGAARELGLHHLRSATVVQMLDENGRSLRQTAGVETNGHLTRPRLRRLVVSLDALMYKVDSEKAAKGKADVYEAMNVVVRRKGRENNFKPILESIQTLALSDVPLPSWLQEVFLGYGDPSSANYTRLPNRLKAIDFRDTFLSWQHLVESLPGKTIQPSDDAESSFGPPYILEAMPQSPQPLATKSTKKRRREEVEPMQQAGEAIKVSPYKPQNTGPYPTDTPKTNQIHFTPAQVEAITSGSQPGLTIIVGPPGTGKTDVATQIINNLYHNFPGQRTLLVAHSNQALNQLFQKIIALDIDERHLLRLGHGEEDLETNASYSKHGRVESFLENRAKYLAEVDRLAANFGAPGAHGNSCETAGYFNSVYVKPAWTNYLAIVSSAEATAMDAVEAFPFHNYFQDAPQPLFPSDGSKEQILDVATGCQRHVEKIFSELEDIRPFEILRTSKDKANYLLVKEARIIAMTSTHAAMRRQEIAGLGFHYDNVVMEEAAQITEIENFIPLALQTPKNGQLPLQRVVLCGDHLQNSPIVQNLAFRQYANLEQSLFLRLVRLGVPTINLDQQGRARPTIAELYKWRYRQLGNLPAVENGSEFKQANPGFRYDYQFVNVPEYKGLGEMEPTPHFIQNLGEAEYAVAIYQYMRLLGYPASRISILTTYAGQRSLIKDVLNHRCAKNRLFGLPRIVTTVDKYQGEQNDYVILSLTRTSRVGYLRDIRRLTVALSRARLGLYILGRREVFESCYELKEAFNRLSKRPDRLILVTGETFPTPRLLEDEVDGTEMEGVEHLGQYVYEMTQAKIAVLKAETGEQGVMQTIAEDLEMAEADDEDIDHTDELEELENIQ
ncbi:MAG: hypothetical protein M1830_001128 [Pleopsidium flavum]|nr:MAG: hypothetical protein M1830_001128 [Pleopsidium flavum]